MKERARTTAKRIRPTGNLWTTNDGFTVLSVAHRKREHWMVAV